ARNGMLFTRDGKLMIRNARHTRDPRPVEEGCACYTCGRFSRGALRHRVLARELLGAALATVHHLHFYLRLMREFRAALREGSRGGSPGEGAGEVVSRSVLYRVLLFVVLTAATIVFLVPTFVRPAPAFWPWRQPVRLGLDLQGGTHLLYGVEIEQAIDNTVD